MLARAVVMRAAADALSGPEHNTTRVRAQRAMRQLSQELKAHVFYISESHVESAVRALVRQRVTNVIKDLWSGAAVVAYGSTVTHMALPNSDVDLAVVAGYTGAHPWFELVSRLVAAGVCAVESTQVITTSRVPVVKLVESSFGMAVDITFGVDPAPTLALVKRWHNEMPQLHALVLLIKSILSQFGLNNVYDGGLGSFTLVVMCRHFLCTLDADDQPAKQPPAWAGKENGATTKSQKKSKINANSSLGPLLLQLLQYYAAFANETLAVCADGAAVKKPLETLEPPQSEPGALVVLNPLIADRAVNMASSSYRWRDVRTMFAAVEKQLRLSVNASHTPPSIWQTVWLEDPNISEYRAFLSSVMMIRPARTSSKRDLVGHRDAAECDESATAHADGPPPTAIVPLDSPIKKQRACDVSL